MLSLETRADTNGECQLSSVRLVLTVGDGSMLHTQRVSFAWQTGVVYTASAVLTAAGPQQLFLNGQLVDSLSNSFQPAQAALSASLVDDSGIAIENYILRQTSLQVSNGTNLLNLEPNAGDPVPLPLVLLPGGPAPWNTAFAADPTQTTTITASFRFDSVVSDPHEFDPYIDTYGQAIQADWPAKIQSDTQLQATVQQEQAWLNEHPPIPGLDQFGGSTLAGWSNQATGYYRTAQHNGRWYLISPMGNPLFYLGLTSIGATTSPISGRESMFQLPANTGALAAAYSIDSLGATDVSFTVANQVRKYGSSWQNTNSLLFHQRLAAWGFAGGGKFGSFPSDLPTTPILAHNGAVDVPDAVPDGHPDVFNPAIVGALQSALYSGICPQGSNNCPNLTNAFIIGWAVGNESEETIRDSEVRDILDLDASTLSTNGAYAKRALVDYALALPAYGNNVSLLASNWSITASNVSDVYAATNITAPLSDVRLLRLCYQNAYWSTLYQIVKSIDPNHLYFGTWVLAAFNPDDWPLAATNSDVIGFDDFTPGPLEPQVAALFTTTSNKPVMLGAWGVPSDYAGMRGFGWNQDTDAMTLSDSASGDAYDLRLQSLAANPYVVGAMVFQYNDQPLAGNGSGSSSNLVNGENRAFGMVDVTDTPKYDLVNKVRTANLTALESIGLLPPSLSLARQSDNSIVISWPVSVTGFTLQNASSWLSTNWVATPNVQSNQVIISPSKRREFYRLQKQ